MLEIRKTDAFDKWVTGLADKKTRERVLTRIVRVSEGNLGDVKNLGEVYELRLHFGAGYRIYFVIREGSIVILLAGGDKDTQDKDIKLAEKLAKGV